MRRLPILLALSVLLLPTTAQAAPKRCKSADLRYAFAEGQPKHFGVHRLRVTGGSCKTAHRVADAWMDEFEARIRRPGKLVLPKRIEGFTFKTLAPTAAQTYNQRGRKGKTTIRFDYVVPNG